MLNGALKGIIAIGFPALASLKSQLVPDQEQGKLQCALNVVTVLTGGLGSVVFGQIFQVCNSANEWTDTSGMSIYVAGALLLLVLSVIHVLPDLSGDCHKVAQLVE